MQTKNLELLNEEFKKIRALGYVKSARKGYTGVGKTLEDLLGKKEDNLDMPDYNGIEITTNLGYTNSYTTLFNLKPSGIEMKELCMRYGYPDKETNKNILNVSITSASTLISNRYYFNLKIDYKSKKILLIIKNRIGQVLEDKIYWSFEQLKQKINKKLQLVAIVYDWPTARNNKKYYKYYQIKYYKLKNFNKFIELIEQGTIRISFKIGFFKSGPKKDLYHDRGTSFELEAKNFYKLFKRIYIWSTCLDQGELQA